MDNHAEKVSGHSIENVINYALSKYEVNRTNVFWDTIFTVS